MESGVREMAMELELERNTFIEAMKRNGCPMWMFETDEDGNFEDMTMAHSWYAWRERAKAQAVPDGYVLLPRVPTEKFKEDLKQHLDELWWGDHGCDWDGFVSVNGIDPLKIYALAIEASESGVEE